MDLELSLSPAEKALENDTAASGGAAALEVDLEIEESSIKSSGFAREELLAAIKSGVETACVQGKLLNLCYIYFVLHVHVRSVLPKSSVSFNIAL